MLCIKLVNYWDKYTEMHTQQNVKKKKKKKKNLYNWLKKVIYKKNKMEKTIINLK